MTWLAWRQQRTEQRGPAAGFADVRLEPQQRRQDASLGRVEIAAERERRQQARGDLWAQAFGERVLARLVRGAIARAGAGAR